MRSIWLATRDGSLPCLNLVQDLAARLASLEVVVALHGLLQGEAAIDLRKENEGEKRRVSGNRVGGFVQVVGSLTARDASNDCLICW